MESGGVILANRRTREALRSGQGGSRCESFGRVNRQGRRARPGDRRGACFESGIECFRSNRQDDSYRIPIDSRRRLSVVEAKRLPSDEFSLASSCVRQCSRSRPQGEAPCPKCLAFFWSPESCFGTNAFERFGERSHPFLVEVSVFKSDIELLADFVFSHLSVISKP